MTTQYSEKPFRRHTTELTPADGRVGKPGERGYIIVHRSYDALGTMCYERVVSWEVYRTAEAAQSAIDAMESTQ